MAELVGENVWASQGGEDDEVPVAAASIGAPVDAAKEAVFDVDIGHGADHEDVDVAAAGVDEGA